MKSLKILQFCSLFLLLLVTGVFWGTWFALSRSLENFSALEFIHIGKIIIANLAIPMRIIIPLCILFIVLSLWFYPKRSFAFYLGIVALVVIIISLLITLIVEVPIDNQIKQWTAATIPLDWETIRDRWQTFHTIRTFTSLTSFACFLTSILVKD